MEPSADKDVKLDMKSQNMRLSILVVILVCLGAYLIGYARTQKEPIVQVAQIRQNHSNKQFFTMLGKVNLDESKDFNLLAFFDSQNGLVVSTYEDAFYRTSNAGQTWQRTDIGKPSDSSIVSVDFVTNNIGWMVLQRDESGIRDVKETQSWIMQTNDGGRNWQQQYTAKARIIRRALFVNEQEGWAIGGRFRGNDLSEVECFVLHTVDAGKSWVDVSESLNRTLADCGTETHDSVAAVGVSEPTGIVILSSRGRLVETTDGGQHWNQQGSIKVEPMLKRAVRMNKSGLRVLASRDGNHGAESVLLHRDGDKAWVKNSIGDVSLSDVLFIDNDKILACGAVMANGARGSSYGRREGVILFSNDVGRSWTVAYQTAETQGINAMKFVKDVLWVAGSNGFIAALQPNDQKFLLDDDR